ncbi:hypothetical protein B0H14DRAFT_3615944, partial [Mycena olivaceomarginata]
YRPPQASLGPEFVASDRKADINGLVHLLAPSRPSITSAVVCSTCAPTLHTGYRPRYRPSIHPCVRDTLHLLGHCRQRARYLPRCALDGSLVARRSRARFPPPCALVARRLRPRLSPRYLHHARPTAAAYALDISACAPVSRRSRAPSPLHARSLLAAPAPRYLHHARSIVAARSLRLRACFPPLPRSIPAPCARSLAAALDLCCARARYPPLPRLFPPHTGSLPAARSRFLSDTLSIPAGHALVVHRHGLLSCPRLCARCTLASAASDVHFLSVFATPPLVVCPLNLFPVDGRKPGRIRVPL